MKKTLIILSLFLLIGSCKDDCPVEPDPCSEYPEEMEISLMWPNYILRTSQETPYVSTIDTAFSIHENIKFQTNFEYDSIFWQVGNDPTIVNNSSYSVQFQNEGVIKIRAFCYRDTNRVCFGQEDNGIDTLEKTIVLHDYREALILGTYRGTNDGESDSFNYRIWYDTLESGHINPYHAGLPKDYKGIDGVKIERFNIYGSTSISSDISEYDFYGRLQADGQTIKVYWRTLTFPNILGPQRVFTGIRIE